MAIWGEILKGKYFDSVTLMNVGKRLSALPGVEDAAVVMATRENREILAAAGLMTTDFQNAGDSDLLAVVKATGEQQARQALQQLETLIAEATARPAAGDEFHPASLDGARHLCPAANLSLISVAGRYAGTEARKSLEQGLHVMLFSDNVPIEQEIFLKKLALKKGLLMMGPDCGTAIINGVPLGFANAVRRGNIGVVGASGTGIQELTSLISNHGGGISQAIGTGSRDVSREVGGIMMIEGLKALGADSPTAAIVLISKPPHPAVVKKLQKEIAKIKKPVLALFLGADGPGENPATLEEAALMALATVRGEDPAAVHGQIAAENEQLHDQARQAAQKRRKSQKFLRGLYSGGTFCAEAQVVLRRMIGPLHSNAPIPGSPRLESALKSREHTVVDMGEDQFTVGRPHPMIDYSLRCRRITEEAGDPQTAVILLDVVLGFGAHPAPANELAPVISRAAKKVTVVCSVTGTDGDPQNRSQTQQKLRKAGAIVLPSHAAACRFAGHLIENLQNA